MNIRSVSNLISGNPVSHGIRRRLFDMIPNMTIKKEDLVFKIGRVLSRPDVGRAVMGATAILTQPFIDYYNPKVDRDTAKVSTCRTIGKIIAGTTVGCLVRSMCYYGTQALTSLKPNAPAWRKSLLPPEIIVRYMNKHHPNWIKNYNSALATLIGLGAMLFTNVLVDVPFTNFITKKLMPIIGGKKTPDLSIYRNYPKNESGDARDKIYARMVTNAEYRNSWRANL